MNQSHQEFKIHYKSNNKLAFRGFFNGLEFDGECMWFNTDGTVIKHRFYIDGKESVDLIGSPELKTILALTHGSHRLLSKNNH